MKETATESKTKPKSTKGTIGTKNEPRNLGKASKRAKKSTQKPKNLNNELDEEKNSSTKDVDMPLRETLKTTETDPNEPKDTHSSEVVTQSSASVSSDSSDKTAPTGNNDTTNEMKTTSPNNKFYALDENAKNNKNPNHHNPNPTRTPQKSSKETLTDYALSSFKSKAPTMR